MRQDIFNHMLRAGRIDRRGILRGAAATGALAAIWGAGLVPRRAFAQDNADLRAQILQIPGVGAGKPHGRRLAEGRRDVPRIDEERDQAR